MKANAEARDAAVWRALAGVPDPEIPVLSVVELGIVRDIAWRDDELSVTLTPTYSGCPATEAIFADVGRALASAGFARYRLEMRLAPAWTTDWMGPEARAKLAAYGVAPPGPCPSPAVQRVDLSALRRRGSPIACPRCGSHSTREISRFGSTPCKAQHVCNDCLEPFDYFKPH